MSERKEKQVKQTFVRGQTWRLADGRRATLLEKQGEAYRMLVDDGKLEMIYPRQLEELL